MQRSIPTDPPPNLFLSAFALELSSSVFKGWFERYTDENFDRLSTRRDVAVSRLRNRPPEQQLLVIPLENSLVSPGILELSTDEFRIPLARLIATQLPRVLPGLKLEDERMGLFRVQLADDLVATACKKVGVKPTPVLMRLHKYARTHFKVRAEYLPGCQYGLWLSAEFDRKYHIDGTAQDLIAAGISIVGLEALRSEYVENMPSYLGTVVAQDEKTLTVLGENGSETFAASLCRVEASLHSFQRLLRDTLSASQFDAYQVAERQAYAAAHCGDGYIGRIEKAQGWLADKQWLEVAPGLRFRVGPLISPSLRGPNPSAVQSRDIFYCFSPDRSKTHKYPTAGLEQFGPFDGRKFDKKEPRIWIIHPDGYGREVEQFAALLFEGLESRHRRFSQGLRRIYHLERVFKQFTVVIQGGTRSSIAEQYISAMKSGFNSSAPPDLAIVVMRDEDLRDSDELYLATKSYLLGQGIPSQGAKISKITAAMKDLPYTLETMAVAIYAKLGGTPWTVAPSVPLYKELVFGMAYAEFGGRFRSRKRYTGIATVFSNDGTYLLTAASPRCRYEEYTEKLAETVYATLKRLAEEYGWLPDDLVRVVFHSPKPLTRHDTEAVLRAAREALVECGITEISSAFLTIQHRHPFKLIDRNAGGSEQFVERLDGRMAKTLVGKRYPRRGTVVNLGRRKRLLCVSSANMALREDDGMPHPLQLELHRASSYEEMTALTRQVYEFTGLSWRSTKPITEPVTISYSRLIADLMTRLDGIPGWNDSLLDTRLRRSRWFL